MQKSFLGYVLRAAFTFSNVAYPCAHNFESDITGVGYAYYQSHSIHRFELIAGDVQKDKHPLKIYFVKHDSKVRLLSPKQMDKKDPVTHKSPLDNFKFIEQEMKMVDQREGVARGSSSATTYHVERVGTWEVKWARYKATEEVSIEVEDGQSQTVKSNQLFSYLMKLHGFVSTHEAQMNQSLSEGLKIGYDVIVLEGVPIENKTSKQTNLAVQFITPLVARDKEDRVQEFYEEMIRVKTLDYFISSKGMYGFWMPQVDVKITEDMLAMNDCQNSNKKNCAFKKRIPDHILYRGPWDIEPDVNEAGVVTDPGSRIQKPRANIDKKYLDKIWESAYFFDYSKASFHGLDHFESHVLNFNQFSKDKPDSLLYFRMYPINQSTGAEMLLYQSR